MTPPKKSFFFLYIIKNHQVYVQIIRREGQQTIEQSSLFTKYLFNQKEVELRDELLATARIKEHQCQEVP